MKTISIPALMWIMCAFLTGHWMGYWYGRHVQLTELIEKLKTKEISVPAQKAIAVDGIESPKWHWSGKVISTH